MSLTEFGTAPALTHLPVTRPGAFQITGDSILNCYFQELLGPRLFGSVLNVGAGSLSNDFGHVKMFAAAEYHTFEMPGCPSPATYTGTAADMVAVANDRYDWVLSTAVLEHVEDPWAVAREQIRVCKPGGYIYCLIPFAQIVHFEPRYSDYWRFTPRGLQVLFAGADLCEVEVWGDNPAFPNGYAVVVRKHGGSEAIPALKSHWIDFRNELPWLFFKDEPRTTFDWPVYRLLIEPMQLAHQIQNARNQYQSTLGVPVAFADVVDNLKNQYAQRIGTLGIRGGSSYFDRIP